jgi:DNA polymerase III sliding clamp (beta) subunit (PCNA family)
MIKLDKFKSKLAQFIQRAQSQDESRLALCGIYIENDSVVAVDGHRLHAIKLDALPELEELKGKVTDLGKIRSGENILEPEVIEGKYPDILQVIPNKEPTITFGINPKLLVDAIKTLDKNSLVISLHTPLEPIELFGKMNGEEVYMLIMPMNIGKSDIYWKPK